jgi:hypothetical protein
MARYFLINTLGDVDGERAILDKPPEGLGLRFHRPARGLKTADVYPKDARIRMSKRYRGVKLDSLIGNTNGYLIVKKPVQDVIEATCESVEIEYLPFTLYNQKNRVQSTEYVIVNPIGSLDCLNLKASEIEYLDEPGDPYHGEVVDVEKVVLDPGKLGRKTPALFRIKEKPNQYVISEELAEAFKKKGFTNIILTEIEQQDGKAR